MLDHTKPLVISDAHANFQLDKKVKTASEETVGEPNDKHIVC